MKTRGWGDASKMLEDLRPIPEKSCKDRQALWLGFGKGEGDRKVPGAPWLSRQDHLLSFTPRRDPG